MATLQIRPRDPSQARQSTVTITLCNSAGARIDGYTSAGAMVVVYTGRTNAVGVLDVDVTPNADITPANSYYNVEINRRSSLIEKSGATQTVFAALVANPNDLTPILTGIGLDGGTAPSIYGGTTPIDGGTA